MSSTPPPNPLLQRPGYALKRAQHALRTRLDEALRPLRLTTPQYAVLAAIEREPGSSNAALARAAFVTAQTMQGIVANLERDGLLRREAHPTHGRILRGELTQPGHKVLRKAHAVAAEIEAVMTAGISQEQAALLTSLLLRCVEALQTGGE